MILKANEKKNERKFILFHENMEICSFSVEIQEDRRITMLSIENRKGEAEKFSLFNDKANKAEYEKECESFIRNIFSRKIGIEKEELRELLGEKMGKKEGLALQCAYGVLPQDSYWFKPVDSKVTWEDLNPYSKESAIYKIKDRNRSNANLIHNPRYASFNTWTLLGDNYTFIKKGGGELDKDNLTPLQEFIVMNIGKSLGIEMLNYNIGGIKEESIVLSKDMSKGKYDLVTLSTILKRGNAMQDRINFSYESIKQALVINGLKEEYIDKRFGEMMILDSFIGNSDRHLNNIAFICDKKSGKIIEMAPLYDNSETFLFSGKEKIGQEYINQIYGKEIYTFDDLAKKGFTLNPNVDIKKIQQEISKIVRITEVYEKSIGFKEKELSNRIEENLKNRIKEVEKIKEKVLERREPTFSRFD